MVFVYLIFAQIIIFSILLFALRKIMYSTSVQEVKRLQILTEETEKKKQQLTSETENLKKEYEKKIKNLETQVQEIKSSVKEEAIKEKEQLLEAARVESRKIINQAVSAKEKIKEELKQEALDKVSADVLVKIKKIFNSKNQKLLHEGLIDDILEELAKLNKNQIKVNQVSGVLIVPSVMQNVKKQKIIDTLREKIDSKITLEEKIDESIIAGVVIKFGSVVIDGSLAAKLKVD